MIGAAGKEKVKTVSQPLKGRELYLRYYTLSDAQSLKLNGGYICTTLGLDPCEYLIPYHEDTHDTDLVHNLGENTIVREYYFRIE